MSFLQGCQTVLLKVINFYMNLLMDRGSQGNMPKVYCFSTFFYPKLISGGHQAVRRWTKQVDLFSYQFIVIPVHLGMHWCLAVSPHTFLDLHDVRHFSDFICVLEF